MTLAPLGDQAVLAYFPTEADAVRFAYVVRAANPPWLQDVVPAYANLGLFFDADEVTLPEVMQWMQSLVVPEEQAESDSLLVSIPVCYERQLDMERIRDVTGLETDSIIALHTETEFHVHAIGFVPGFPYMGYLPEPLHGVGRLPSPRVRVEPGSVGITGKQTGIYPLPRPGGWNILGRTPLTIVDVADGFFPLRVGDRVRFVRIDEAEYTRLEGERLLVPGRDKIQESRL
jgi:inhibitor of KinA